MKTLFKFIAWLLALIIVLVVILYLTAGIWIRPVVSAFVPRITKTPTSLEKADISLFRGQVQLKGFKIANPAGFSAPNAFELGEVFVKFEPKSVLTSKIVINEIKIDGTKVDAEFAKTGQMNLMVLNDNIQAFLKNPATTKTQPQQNKTTTEKSARSVVVKDLKIMNSSLDFTFLNQRTQVKLPNIHEKNIGEKKKETLVGMFANIFEKLSLSSFNQISKSSQESVNKLLDSLAGRSKEASIFVKDLQTGIKNMF